MSSEAGSAIICGVGPGMGMSLARRFGREGLGVGLIARTAPRLDEFVDQLANQNVVASAFPADIADATQLTVAIGDAITKLGPPDVLVYNASSFTEGKPTELEPENFVRSLRVNAVGLAVAAEAVVGGMRARGAGTILITGGGTAIRPVTALAELSAGKAAVRNLAHSLAAELEPEGIHVATVTIDGLIRHGSNFDPDRIADVYWQIHREPKGAWTTEYTYD